MNIIHEIESTVKTSPDRLVFRSRSGELTYGELWEKSTHLAAWIREHADASHFPIPVYGHKEPMMLVCFLACTRSGHPYCPIDPNMPAQRIRMILEETESPLALTCRDLKSSFLDAGETIPAHVKLISPGELLDACEFPEAIPDDAQNKPEDIHYIIFTSGSTGRPKGVQISTRALNNYLSWCAPLCGMDGGVFLNQAPFSFDLSVMDLYCAMATGSSLVSVDKAMEMDMSTLLQYLGESGVQCWVSTPSFADLCLSDPAFTQKLMPELRCFLFCGETFRNTTAKLLLHRFPNASVINTYGPTESTVCMTSVKVDSQMVEAENPLPIGHPRPGTEVRIETEPGIEAENGDTGELVIIGDTVASGYFHEPEKTMKSFFLERHGKYFPFPSGTDELAFAMNQGYRPAYRTGDAGRKDARGMIYYKGRMDKQIKFHGYRIELGDIENGLLSLQDVRQAAVLPNVKDGRIRFLTAFVVLQDQSELKDTYDTRKYIREQLKERLPVYMVPRQIKILTRMPLTTNGKVDRNALEREI